MMRGMSAPVASRQGRQGRQSLGAPELKGPPSRVLIFLRTRQLIGVCLSSAPRCVGLRRALHAGRHAQRQCEL